MSIVCDCFKPCLLSTGEIRAVWYHIYIKHILQRNIKEALLCGSWEISWPIWCRQNNHWQHEVSGWFLKTNDWSQNQSGKIYWNDWLMIGIGTLNTLRNNQSLRCLPPVHLRLSIPIKEPSAYATFKAHLKQCFITNEACDHFKLFYCLICCLFCYISWRFSLSHSFMWPEQSQLRQVSSFAKLWLVRSSCTDVH